MFWKTNNSTEQKDIFRNEIFQEYLDPDRLARNLTLAISKKTKSTSGHIHIHFRNRLDHVVYIWSNGLLRKVVAKSPDCPKGQCIKWERSDFCNYEPKEVIGQLHDEISFIRIDDWRLSKTWRSYRKFIRWLSKKIKAHGSSITISEQDTRSRL